MDIAVPVDHRIKLKESEKKDKYLDLARELKKLWDMKVTIITIVVGAFWYSHLRITKRTVGLGNKKTSGDHPIFYIIVIGQNTEKSPGDLRRLAATQTPEKAHQLKLM